VFYAWGASHTVPYHSNSRGTTTVIFFQPPPPAFTPPSDADGSIDIVLNNYVTASDGTQYVLQRFDVGAQVRQIVAIQPLVRDQDNDLIRRFSPPLENQQRLMWLP
jgi:hypothetical protein